MSDLYSYNDTMKLLGQQVGVYAGIAADKGIRDILDAYVNCEEDPTLQAIVRLFQKGFLFGILSDVYTLGVIAGKREERARKKPLGNRKD